MKTSYYDKNKERHILRANILKDKSPVTILKFKDHIAPDFLLKPSSTLTPYTARIYKLHLFSGKTINLPIKFLFTDDGQFVF